MSDEPNLPAYREQIATIDLKILAALNERVRLVKQIKAFKEVHGLAFYDSGQEERLIDALCQGNPGPLSEDGVREVFGLILMLVKREAAG